MASSTRPVTFGQKISFYLFKGFIEAFSRLPFWVLYRFSDVLFVLLFYVFGYRKKVVMGNLKRSFPEKNSQELHRIARASYHNFCDTVIESFKNFNLSEKALLERNKGIGLEVLEDFYQQGKSVLILAPHYANWEGAVICLNQQHAHQATAIYKPLRNPLMNKYLTASRSRLGMQLATTAETGLSFEKWTSAKTPFATYLVTDQSPSNAHRAYWMNFLHQDTACHYGADKYAKQYDLPVVFACARREKRGYYTVTFSTLIEDASALPEGAVIKAFMKKLEGIIQDAPHDWLWTHKRWKKQKPTEAKVIDEIGD